MSFENQFIVLFAILIFFLFLIVSFIFVVLNKRSQLVLTNYFPQNKKIVPIFLSLSIVIILLSSYGLYNLAMLKPKVILTYPTSQGFFDHYEKPVEIVFNAPVDMNKLAINRFPQVTGKIEKVTYFNFLPFGRKVRFFPEVSLNPSSKVMIYLSNISKPFSKEWGGEYLLEFYGAKVPRIVETFPKNNDNAVFSNSSVVFKLSDKDSNANIWDFEIYPDKEFNLIRDFKDSLVLDFTTPFEQNSTYEIKIFHTPTVFDLKTNKILEKGKKQLIKSISFTTVKPPLITSFKPQGENILTNEDIYIEFDEPIDKQNETISKIQITPQIEGNFIWGDGSKSLRFITQEFEKDTNYTVKLAKGIQAKSGGILESDIEYHFKTVGNIAVSSIFPSNDQNNVPINSSIIINFNQEVDMYSAESNFSIKPEVKGEFYWTENTMYYKPTHNFDNETEYNIQLTAGIKSIYGLDSSELFSYNFKTAAKIFLLDVPLFNQEESFTCNIAATRMMLANRGVDMTEIQIKEEIGTFGSRGDGNPYLGYVIDYGTYWDAIIKEVNKYRSARLYKDWNLDELLKEVEKGNPVMVWGQNGWSDPHEISWTTSDGTFIYAINGMHSYVVKGYKGEKDNPTHIIANDPWRGELYLEKDEFINRWNFFKVAMVVD